MNAFALIALGFVSGVLVSVVVLIWWGNGIVKRALVSLNVQQQKEIEATREAILAEKQKIMRQAPRV